MRVYRTTRAAFQVMTARPTDHAVKRFLALAGIVTAGVLSQGAMWIGCPPPAAPPRLDPLALERVAENLYVIKGGGGNTAALVTEAGVLLVDTKLPGYGRGILEQLRTVTDKPVTTIVNTHSHADHVGGNSFLAAADIVAHENTRAHMLEFADRTGVSEPHSAATRTFRDRLVVTSGTQNIELHYFGSGHTDGDVLVVFPALRIVHSGDLFADQTLPVIDASLGGSALALADTLTSAYKRLADVDTVITGHGAVVPWKAFGEYAAFNTHLADWAKPQWAEGVSDEQAAARFQLPPAFSHYRVPQWRLRQHLALIFDELRKPAEPPRRWRGGVG